MKKENKIHNYLNLRGNIDYSIFFAVLSLIAFGVVMVFSSSFGVMFDGEGNVRNIFRQYWVLQLIYGIIGIFIMLFVAHIRIRRYKFLEFFLWLAYVIVIGLLFYVALFVQESRGAARTINLGFIGFQPSELAKIVMIVHLAFYIDKIKKSLYRPKAFLFMVLIVIVPVIGVAIEDFSTSGVLLVIGGGMILVSYRDWKQTFIYGGIASAVAIAALFSLKGSRSSRLSTYGSGAWQDPDGSGRQIIQSLFAIGSGGIFGRGLGQSLQKMGRVTQAHHDIIFAIICEELGLFGAGIILLLYLGLLFQLLQTLIHTTEIYETLIVVGVMIQIAAQVVINVGVASALLPNTGMPLPFVSYGGTSMLILSAEIGIVLSIAKRNNYLYMKRLEEYQNSI